MSVIPGRDEVANPESITTTRSMDRVRVLHTRPGMTVTQLFVFRNSTRLIFSYALSATNRNIAANGLGSI